MFVPSKFLTTLWCSVCCFCCIAQTSFAQTRTVGGPELSVEGKVQKILKVGLNKESVAQILVQKSAALGPVSTTGMRYPAPGELVYVHILEGGSGGIGRNGDSIAIPKTSTYIRAELTLDNQRQWTAGSQKWFTAMREPDNQVVGDFSESIANESARPFGLSTKTVALGRDRALQVTAVAEGSPAAITGIEVGDVLTRIDGAQLSSQKQLSVAESSRQNEFRLTVQDVRTGREVDVVVERSAMRQKPRPTNKSLGVECELAFFEGEAAVKVKSVQPNSPADRAGIVAGLLILKADGRKMLQPDKLVEAEQASDGTMVLEVIEPRTRKTQTVRVDLR